MESFFQRFLFILTITTPTYFSFHRTKCSPLFYLSSLYSVHGNLIVPLDIHISLSLLSLFLIFRMLACTPPPRHRPRPPPHRDILACLFVPVLYVTGGSESRKCSYKRAWTPDTPLTQEPPSRPSCTQMYTSRYLRVRLQEHRQGKRSYRRKQRERTEGETG